MSATTETQTPRRLHTIGAVCEHLRDEFPDISISKIRYLEDQGLIHPRRTRGGYRLFAETDVERLVTILRLQRDEFLPLRVIRDELAAPGATERKRRRPGNLGERVEAIELDELCRRAGITLEQAKDLEEFGLLVGSGTGVDKRYAETDADIAVVCSQLTRYGVDARHLRAFKTAADRQSALLEQLAAPALRARNAERRAAGLRDLQSLTELAQELGSLLLWREVREVGSR